MRYCCLYIYDVGPMEQLPITRVEHIDFNPGPIRSDLIALSISRSKNEKEKKSLSLHYHILLVLRHFALTLSPPLSSVTRQRTSESIECHASLTGLARTSVELHLRALLNTIVGARRSGSAGSWRANNRVVASKVITSLHDCLGGANTRTILANARERI